MGEASQLKTSDIINLRISDTREKLADNIDALLKSVIKGNLVAVKVFALDPFHEELTPVNQGNNKSNNNCTISFENGSDVLSGWGSQERANANVSVLSNTNNVSEMFSGFTGNETVISWPINDVQGKEIVVYVMILVKKSSADTLKTIDSLSKHVSQAYTRVHESIVSKKKASICVELGGIFDQDINTVCRKIGNQLSNRVDARYGVVLLVDKSSEELYTNVFGQSVRNSEYRFEVCKSCLSTQCSSPEAVCIDLSKDTDMANDFKKLVEYFKLDVNLNSLLLLPVVENDGELFAFICLVNKEGNKSFTETDRLLLSDVVKHCIPSLKNGLQWKEELLLKRRNESLLSVTKNLFTHLDDLDTILRKIMEEARNMTNAERCSLFLVDIDGEELIAKVFDGVTKNDDEDNELRIPISHGIAGHVATTGKMLNIPDAYSHPLFYREVDNQTGFKTKNILCFPIKDENGVIGVSQLCNKRTGTCFTAFDEQLTEAFATFCGLSLVQSLLYQKAMESQHRSKLANEMMMYHMQISQQEVEKYTQAPFPSKTDIDSTMDSFNFMPRISLAEADTIKIVLSMFQDLGFCERWKIREHTLVRFCLTVRRGYRDPPYHNWTHAWTVAHFCYLLLKNTDAPSMLKDIECFILFVACLCHDLDHRGTTNSFQIASKSVLAALYSSDGSVMEKHHFAQAMHIINSEGCNIFETLSKKHYHSALDLMRLIILATDLANHFTIVKDIEELARGGYKKGNRRHHRNLLSIMMTSCDLSDQTKPWKGAFRVSDLLYAEFFNQGDMEKSLGYTPKEMMDREKASIPRLQVEFVSKVALPVYRLLSSLLPPIKSICNVMGENILKWQALQDEEELGKKRKSKEKETK
eukprot:Seg1940.2 transcript_id=Seg1940.2/GoldUCD/mRNA.D3Y31 product="cGMP-dependent 3' 5'-cyclic phosphodiesterase" protein_id=Seg1940.2/GoldUCD/D3Y31